MITHTEIELGEYLSTFELFKQLVDVGKWVLVLDSLLVQWTVVNTKSVRSILLLHKCESDDSPYGDQAWRILEHL